MERKLCRVERDNAAHSEVEYVCVKGGSVCDDSAGIGGRVRLPKIVLKPPDGLAEPPAWAGGRHDRAAEK
jgi:hypothetical protein